MGVLVIADDMLSKALISPNSSITIVTHWEPMERNNLYSPSEMRN